MSKAKAQSEPKPLYPTFSENNIAKAKKNFERGQELAGKKNYDYAVECYINGLNFWPEAVEEGHKPCRAAALFRGPTKVSFTDNMKLGVKGKEFHKAMLNAEILLAKQPGNVGYMEALFRNAAKAGYTKTLLWIGELLADAAAQEEKPNPDRFVLLREIYEELGDRAQEEDPVLAITALERAVEALSQLQRLKPQDFSVSNELRDVAGKVTILKGKYSSADSFRDSIRDGDVQAEIRDKERAFQTSDRLDQLIASAKLRYEEEPTDGTRLNELVDLLCRQENEQQEREAIGLLVKAFKATDEYRHKMRADEIRMAQLRRKARAAAAKGDRDATRQHLREQLRYELSVYRERTQRYPMDLRLKYQYGIRLFKAGQYDEAIPVLQEARNDPKTRSHCSLYIGRCFFAKKYYSQAIDTFEAAIAGHEMADDDLGKELQFRVGRAYEEAGRTEDALKTYGQLIQWDYNYRNGEVRKRLDALKAQG